jgi:hypothetical protein
MTREEILKSPQHHSWVKALRRKYPFIKKVEIGDNFEKEWDKYIFFYMVKIYVDNSKLLEMYPGLEMYPFLVEVFEKTGELETGVLLDVYRYQDGSSAYDIKDELWEFGRNFVAYFEELESIPKNFHLKRIPYIEDFIIEP